MHHQGSGYCPGKSRSCTEGTQINPSKTRPSRMHWAARRGHLLYVTQEEGRGTLEQSEHGRGSKAPKVCRVAAQVRTAQERQASGKSPSGAEYMRPEAAVSSNTALTNHH